MSVSFLAENKTMQTIRARVAFHSRQHAFDKCMLQMLDADQRPTGTQIAELYAYWGDPLTPSDEQFLRSCVAEVNAASGPVMLCGASLLTLILGALCDQDTVKSKQVWCLESDKHWANLIRSWLTEYRINAAHVIQSPSRLFDDCVWYAVDTGHLAKSYQLIICDGARSTPKGVMGAITRIDARLDERFTILARNVKGDVAALQTLAGWAKDHGATFALIDKQQGFVKITRQPARTATTGQPAQQPVSRPTVAATKPAPGA